MMRQWYRIGFLTDDLSVREERESEFERIEDREFVPFTQSLINFSDVDHDEDDDDDKNWRSFEIKFIWCYKIKPFSYSLTNSKSREILLNTWNFEGSIDGGKTWEVLKKHENEKELLSCGENKKWNIGTQV